MTLFKKLKQSFLSLNIQKFQFASSENQKKFIALLNGGKKWGSTGLKKKNELKKLLKIYTF